MIYLLFKSINRAKSIGVYNLKVDIEKSTIDKFGNIVTDLLDYMPSNYSIFIDKVEHHEDYVCHIFRALFSGLKSTFNSFIERAKYYWYTVT